MRTTIAVAAIVVLIFVYRSHQHTIRQEGLAKAIAVQEADKFALEVGHTVDFFEEHHTEIIRYGAAALAVAAIVVLIFVYRSHQHTIRQEGLAKAIAVQEAPVGQGAPGAPITFPTQDAKDKEAIK